MVKTNTGSFNGVAPDMKLEQTIQRLQKAVGGIIGQTRKLEYVTEWEAIYHEIPDISNTFRDLVNTKVGDREYDLHHELGGNHSHVFNNQMKKVTDFIRVRGNPFIETSLIKLHNFVTGTSVVESAVDRILNFHTNSNTRYEIFRKARFHR